MSCEGIVMFKPGQYVKLRGLTVANVVDMNIDVRDARYFVENACEINQTYSRNDGKVSYRFLGRRCNWWITGYPENFYQDNECLAKEQS